MMAEPISPDLRAKENEDSRNCRDCSYYGPCDMADWRCRLEAKAAEVTELERERNEAEQERDAARASVHYLQVQRKKAEAERERGDAQRALEVCNTQLDRTRSRLTYSETSCNNLRIERDDLRAQLAERDKPDLQANALEIAAQLGYWSLGNESEDYFRNMLYVISALIMWPEAHKVLPIIATLEVMPDSIVGASVREWLTKAHYFFAKRAVEADLEGLGEHSEEGDNEASADSS